MSRIQLVAKGQKPLCACTRGLLTCRNGTIFLYDGVRFHEVAQITPKKNRFRLTERIRRTEPTSAAVFRDHAYVLTHDRIIDLDLKNKVIAEKIDYRKKTIHASRITLLENVNGFDDGVAYGEYFDNPNHEEVCIFHKTGEGTFKKAFEFPSNTVRHIHALIPDRKRGCVYVLTGDSDEESGIWKATKNFSCVEPLLVGSQAYRACIAFAADDCLVFATDIPSEQNAIYQLNLQSMELKKLTELPASCTTGCAADTAYLFGTTVETKEPENRSRWERVKYLFRRSLPAGIHDRFPRMYLGNTDNGFSEIVKMKKDIWPAGLCQFGRINAIFEDQTRTVYLYPVAVKKYDGKLYWLSL